MANEQEQYAQVMRRAKDVVDVVAARHTIDTRRLKIEFDVNGGPAPHEQHTLTMSLRDSTVAVSAGQIPHDWLSVDTGFVDTRFSKLVSNLLIELHKEAKKAGETL